MQTRYESPTGLIEKPIVSKPALHGYAISKQSGSSRTGYPLVRLVLYAATIRTRIANRSVPPSFHVSRAC